VDRDVKAVHSDVTALLNAGVLDRVPGGGVNSSRRVVMRTAAV
jgi:predicted transcriptional regulator